ncbi:unnamed protein product [Oikopleura dioica]|uniref:Uncharacterized protein n=1 Tax=Oikopleura dioica TaxID=34765 RepID=E4Y5L6_OIKDI|nr:unnamed protein product [Oikopleura dioica]
MMMDANEPLYGVEGIGELLEEEESELDVQKYLYKALAEHVEELSRENEELQAQNRHLRSQISPTGSDQKRANCFASNGNENALGFAFSTDNPALQMDELRKEIEALNQAEYAESNSGDNLSIFTDSGNNSEIGSHWSLSGSSSTFDMSRVQRCQRKIAELEKEADQARRYNRSLILFHFFHRAYSLFFEKTFFTIAMIISPVFSQILFRAFLKSDFADQLRLKARALGDSVLKARPYFDALRKSKNAKGRTSHFANQYTRAQQILKASRDLVANSEQKMMSDPTNMQWLELLNEANDRANQASAEKTKIQCRHEEAAQNYRLAEEVAAQLLKAERRNIKKATTYFELKTTLEQKLEESRKAMQNIDFRLVEAKEN